LYAESSLFLAEYLDKVSIIPNGVDLDRFKPDLDVSEFKGRLGLGDEKIILFAGRFVHYKGLFFLLEAFSALCKVRTDVKLVLLGTGPLMDAVRRRVHFMGLDNRVLLVGSVSEEDLPRFYVASDMVVVPSRSRSEGFSISALQGMACGRPVIATRVGGVPFLVRNGETGLVVEPRSWEKLAEAISRVLKDTALATRLGRDGRRRAERFFSWGRVAKMTEEMYETIL
jgi:glycosyltransferase involved in cell wall biosynthesis